jgi:hypothetical protein
MDLRRLRDALFDIVLRWLRRPVVPRSAPPNDTRPNHGNTARLPPLQIPFETRNRLNLQATGLASAAGSSVRRVRLQEHRRKDANRGRVGVIANHCAGYAGRAEDLGEEKRCKTRRYLSHTTKVPRRLTGDPVDGPLSRHRLAPQARSNRPQSLPASPGFGQSLTPSST